MIYQVQEVYLVRACGETGSRQGTEDVVLCVVKWEQWGRQEDQGNDGCKRWKQIWEGQKSGIQDT